MVHIVDLALSIAAVPVALCAGYLLLLTLASARSRPPAPAPPRLRFNVVVPAHDEEAGIAPTVASLLALDYPASLRRVTVVADNCSDRTAERARAAGATVLIRDDAERRGKGYALRLAFERILAEGLDDAVVVVDADTVVSSNLLRAFAARLERGCEALQSLNLVQNVHASWRTRLMAVAFSTTGTLRALGRDRLGCSVGLRGNGMCLATSLLREIPHDAFSIVEDAEYGIRLAWAGKRVRLVQDGEVRSEMVSGSAGSASQRRRWEEGRAELRRQHAWRLLAAGLRRRDRVLLDIGVDLVVPPLAQLGAAAAAGLAVTAGAGYALGTPLLALWPWCACAAALLVHVGRGWILSGTGLGGLAGLAHVPVYLAWKIGLRLTRPSPAPGTQEWKRTEREADRRPNLPG